MNRIKKKKLFLIYLGIFAIIFILNCLTHRSIGDDYLYSFVWEGHSMYEPLSENARRIASFSDIAESTYSYFMTWGGRVVAQALAMWFLWMPRRVFNVAVSFATVLLVLGIQWVARGGQMTMKLSAKEAALIFFCLWAFHANFVGVFIWTDGSCNYLFPMVFLLLFLLPYVRHYMSGGQEIEKSWLPVIMFPLGILAGNSNENTICWIGLFGFFYILHAYRKGTGKFWMVTGFLGLTMGYGLLMLAPGNFLRISDSGETLQNFLITPKKWLTIWFNSLLQSMLWFYLWKVFRNRKILRTIANWNRYKKLIIWLAVNSLLFDFIMLLSPEFPNRSLFPGLIFAISAVFVAAYVARQEKVDVLKGNLKLNYGLAVVYFCFTFSTTIWWYVQEYQYEADILMQAKQLEGKQEVLIVENAPPNNSLQWTYLTGLHRYGYSLSSDEKNWRNVAFARFHQLKGVYVAAAAREAETIKKGE